MSCYLFVPTNQLTIHKTHIWFVKCFCQFSAVSVFEFEQLKFGQLTFSQLQTTHARVCSLEN